ncbi:MAG: YdiU family protein [Acidobacteria bacterium]|nr:YdiU family protein [Acidobacteriota bacterium]
MPHDVPLQETRGAAAVRDDRRAGGWRLEHSYTTLPPLLFSRVTPTPVRAPHLVIFNTALAQALGLDAVALNSSDGASVFAGNSLPYGADPIAQAYAGHQFGGFTTLGDGRAILLGEQITPEGRRVDVQLKGPGLTPYSRRGDGRAALGPMLREFIISEAMHGLGIPTSRSLAVVATGEPVYRERTLAGAVLTRVAASHIRVGTFEWAGAHRDTAALTALADYTRQRHYPELADHPEPHLALFDAIVERQAQLIARWQLVGFIHGVMNTDNMAVSGETLDYGPCAFMDRYDPLTVFSSIDQQGRYSYGNQPAIGQWNLARLAEAMLPLFDAVQERAIELATASLDRYAERFQQHWLDGMRAKLGLFAAEADDAALVDDLLAWMERAGADFTNTFRDLSSPEARSSDEAFRTWESRWLARRQRQPQTEEDVRARMDAHNPAVIARNHKVEGALAAATERGDLSPLERLLSALSRPFDRTRDLTEFAPPTATDVPYRTFCGT